MTTTTLCIFQCKPNQTKKTRSQPWLFFSLHWKYHSNLRSRNISLIYDVTDMDGNFFLHPGFFFCKIFFLLLKKLILKKLILKKLISKKFNLKKLY